MNKPIYCFTSDIDFSTEPMIKYMLNVFKRENIKLTPFITHRSKIIELEYGKAGMRRVGLHPNFYFKSTHGETYDEIISHVISLNPSSKFFRSHSFFDNTKLTDEFKKRGFKFDSNLCLHLQNNIIPLKHSSGLLRFPVFLEDDIYLRYNPDFKVKTIGKQLLSTGLKIFNIHPIHIYSNKKLETFILDLIRFLKKHSEHEFYYLYDLYEMLNNDQ